MKIYIGNDHAGVIVKNDIVNHFQKEYEFVDFGTNSESSVDYPKIAIDLAQALIKDKKALCGILICGSGEGMCIAANKVKGIRCGLAYNENVAKLIKQHNNANIIAFGAREFDSTQIIKMLEAYLQASFEQARHAQRINLINDYEKIK